MPGMENSCGSLLSPGVALDLTMRPGRNGAQRSVPTGGAGLRLRNGRRAKLFFLPLTKPGAHAPGLVCLFRKKSLPCVKGGGGFYGAPAKAQRKRVWWGEEVRRRERDLSRLSGARRGIHSPHRRDGGIDVLPGLLSGLPARVCSAG